MNTSQDNNQEEEKQHQSISINDNVKENFIKKRSNSNTSNKSGHNNAIEQFDCHICFDISKEPVITSCGHLFCWSCIYRWLNNNNDFLQCPVCKNGITTETLIPIYTKQEYNPNNEEREEGIPPRPNIRQRTQPVRNQNAIGEDGNFMHMNRGQNLQSGTMIAGYGFFPSLFNLQFQVDNIIDDAQEDVQSPEIQHQELFKKIYYVTGSFLSICILMLV